MNGLYDFHFGIPAYIVEDAVLDQWLPTASPIGTQGWMDSDADDTLYAHTVLLSLSPLNPYFIHQKGRSKTNMGVDLSSSCTLL